MYHTRLHVTCNPDFSEILMAEVGEAGFDTFLEIDGGFEAYAEQDNFNKNLLEDIKQKYQQVNPLIFSMDRIQKQNWNEEWEKNLTPIIVDDTVLIRAEFHKIEKQYPYEIIITPKMSFGTGHHQTTYLMLRNQLKIDHQHKRVMDAGCGTAILSVMAAKLGAAQVEAFDIDDWSTVNGKENIENNMCANINLRQGTIKDMKFDGRFDVILANINKNVLLAEMKLYASHLSVGGTLLLSGFYTNDVEDLKQEAAKYGFLTAAVDERETWAALLLNKIT
jgi:ribosomal protein L11 methyltransferase